MIRRLLYIVCLVCVTAAAVAQTNIECVGTATQVVQKGDTLFFFADEVHLRSRIGAADWYSTQTGALVQSNAEEIYPDDGGYYLRKAGVNYTPVYAFTYPNYAPSGLTAEVTPYCQKTDLTVSGTVPTISYINENGQSRTYARACTIYYTTLAWNTEQWVDSLAQSTETLRTGTYQLPPIYRATDIVVRWDDAIADALGLMPDSVVGQLLEPHAVTCMPTTITTTRGGTDRSNEIERPKEASVLRGSAPLEIAFYSNPTPAAEYFSWRIYRGSDLIVQRQDEDLRYTFMEPGAYRVVHEVSNRYCPCADAVDPDCQHDSVEILVNVSESQLLVPNVFTPNGDGQNDEFRVVYRSIREFHCWIYNRWGKLVYEFTDPAKGWDGTINGRPAAEGAYFYVIRAMGTDADKNAQYVGLKASYKKRKLNADDALIGVYQLSGDINLIRGK
ncbi:MAG: gliding motility-associated C-terminal domain-containing protein [Paludibacteraceae bacterium]|nr:gliding motility-associated C-terminal domain-containing protein [Paludibacteraceae bacterium]